jgi:hypothetical protein
MYRHSIACCKSQLKLYDLYFGLGSFVTFSRSLTVSLKAGTLEVEGSIEDNVFD